MQITTIAHKSHESLYQEQYKVLGGIKVHKKTMGIVIAIVATFIVGSYILGNIPLPSSSMGSIFDPPTVYKNGLGAVNGYVFSSPQIPVLGTIMVATEQSGQFQTVSIGLEPDGKYVFQDLKPGKYMIIAYFPDGEYRVMKNIQVEPNSVQTLIFKY